MKATVKITLDETIKKSKGELTRNKIAVQGRIRPATISELCNGKSKSISFDTLTRILDAMNEINHQNGGKKRYQIEDVLTVEYVDSQAE
ncbi:helix-turn-helix domain-containing protein [Virgibacillus dakarensis]|uniref:helix-turn-helix domain-containing protein n=1 Tax=Virgibacillus dakarensis TaxID=1917889 RepID=UPI000B447DFA|nr:helix-turn-helix domain-containing protein [Virgibacillus dakarensis]